MIEKRWWLVRLKAEEARLKAGRQQRT